MTICIGVNGARSARHAFDTGFAVTAAVVALLGLLAAVSYLPTRTQHETRCGASGYKYRPALYCNER